MRITKKIILDLTIFMICTGLFVGILFPFFSVAIGVPKEYIYTPGFYVLSILTSISLTLLNVIIVERLISKRFQRLADKMNFVNDSILGDAIKDQTDFLDSHKIVTDTKGVVGASETAFNNLIGSFVDILSSEASIKDFTEIFTKELDLQKLSDKALEHMIEFTGSKAGMIVVDEGGELKVISSHLIKDADEVAKLEIVQKCFDNNKQELFQFDETVKIETGLLDFYPKSMLIEPVSYKGEVLGVFLLASLKDLGTLTKEEMEVYNDGLSLGMHNALIHDKLQKIAILDPLTNIYNRRFGTERLKEEFSKAVRFDIPLALMMFDIDHFKVVNDTYGHIVGDKVLANIAQLLKINLRIGDVLIRFGGEEFLAILPATKLEGLKVVSEKVRTMVEKSYIIHNDQEIKVTISIGATSFPERDVNNVDELLKQADNNLYEAKDAGRNRVVIK